MRSDLVDAAYDSKLNSQNFIYLHRQFCLYMIKNGLLNILILFYTIGYSTTNTVYTLNPHYQFIRLGLFLCFL